MMEENPGDNEHYHMPSVIVDEADASSVNELTEHEDLALQLNMQVCNHHV